MDVVLQRIESVNQPQAISRLVFIGVVPAPAPDALPAPQHGLAQPVDSLILTMADAEAAAFKVNQIYTLSLVAKA